MRGSHSSVSVDSSVLGYCTMCIGKQQNIANYWPAVCMKHLTGVSLIIHTT